MSIYMVTWNLNSEGIGYDQARRAFLKHLERYDNMRDSGLDSVRWISTGADAYELEADLRLKLDTTDRLFVTHLVSGHYQGWLDPEVWNWIDARLAH